MDTNEMIKQLQNLVSGNKSNDTQQKVTEETKPNDIQQTNQVDNSTTQQNTFNQNEAVQKLKMYKELGTGRFIALNASLPYITKIYPICEQKAHAKLIEDIQKGNPVKDDYVDYLEEAKNAVMSELKSLHSQVFDFKAVNKKEEDNNVNYKLKDFYNDYKKMLLESTTKEASLEFRDGLEIDGKVRSLAKGKAMLDKVAEIT
jgi:hypothetical protein